MKISVKKFNYILTVLLLLSTLSAQEIYFCNSYSEDGDPIDARNIWSIKPWGSDIYILLDNEDNPIDDKLNFMFVDRYIDGSYRPFDSKAINVKSGATWFAYNYKFSDSGKYKVYFVDGNKNQIASGIVTIQIEDDYVNNRQGATSLYYDGVKVKFCQQVVAGHPVNEIESGLLSANDSLDVSVFIQHTSSLNTDIIKVDIWEKETRSIEYEKFIESKKFQIQSTWKYAYFRYTFTKPGDYKFNIYNQNDVLITSGFIKVNR